jgi:beta-lactamase class A
VRDIDSQLLVEIDSQAAVPAASTIKLPLMITVFRAIEDGRVSSTQRHTVRSADVVGGAGVLQAQVGRSLTTIELLETTLLYSDNTGANMLVNGIGGLDAVNSSMAALGYDHTRMRRAMMDFDAQRAGLENTTSAAELADMLWRIYHRTLITRGSSEEMLRILRARGRVTDVSLDFVGRRLRPRPSIAHLNGTLPGIRNDAGIIEYERSRFIVVILLHRQPNESAAEQSIADAAVGISEVLDKAR